MIEQQKCEAVIGYQFKDPKLLVQALCHKSFHKENPEYPHNEKLEFLGDAVVDLVLSDLLMKKFVEDKEGSLSRKRASVVNEERLCQLARQLNIDHFMLVGERDKKSNLRENSRIIASALEAIVGGIYLDSGFQAAYDWLAQLFSPLLEQSFESHDFESDYKTRFQEWVQEHHRLTPRYQVVSQSGPDHEKIFEVEVFVGDELWAKASGNSKKSAAQNAAQKALERISS